LPSSIDYAPYIIQGVYLTVALSLLSFALSLVIGLAGALGRMIGPAWLQGLVQTYILLFRGIPEVVWLFLVYYGGQALVSGVGAATGLYDDVSIGPFAAGVAAIGLSVGAYMIETFRSAAIGIPRGQIEAALACGLSGSRILRRIIWPQLMRNSYAGVMNNWLGLIKGTAVVSLRATSSG
jgi:His/Glu/Gln/Arg/opine family amino acid ABC transporter permease subunit